MRREGPQVTPSSAGPNPQSLLLWTVLKTDTDSASALLDFDLLLLLRRLLRLWQVDAQYSLIELCLDLRRVGLERQGDRSAERAIAAFHNVPVLILVLLFAFGLFLAADSQHVICQRYIDILLIDARQFGRNVDRVLALSNVDLWR
jgi:hypothetical protein